MQYQEQVNPRLINLISRERHHKSRYVIDRLLIEAGYRPVEVDLAWQYLDWLEHQARPDHGWLSRSLILLSSLAIILTGLKLFQPFFRLNSLAGDSWYNAFGYALSEGAPVASLKELAGSGPGNGAWFWLGSLVVLLALNLVYLLKPGFAARWGWIGSLYGMVLMLGMWVWAELAVDYIRWTPNGNLIGTAFRSYLEGNLYLLGLGLASGLIFLAWLAVKRSVFQPGPGNNNNSSTHYMYRVT